ncbi:MAG: glycoside hydrolase family 1 protein, partial [Micromonosporaceae bacterium]
LFHWDTPQALEDAGGWVSRDTAYRLAEYAGHVGERLGDRVRMWMPLNEPVVHTMYGYAVGHHAPGKALGFEALPVVHHLLLGHGLAVRALRDAGCESIGIASHHAPTWPASGSPEDVTAAETYHTLINWLFSDPVLTGRYPEGFDAAMPGPVEDDLKVISTPLDWFGINYYQPALVAAAASSPPAAGSPTASGAGGAAASSTAAGPDGAMLPPGLPFELRTLTGYPATDFGWPVVPDGLREILVSFAQRYGDALPPVYVTESGCSYHDAGPDADGRVRDPERIAYHQGHLAAVADAIAEGVDVRGYFAWSIMDNFEWAAGYQERFGLVYVDYETLKRTPKDSYHWYRDLIRRHQVR